MEIAKENKLAYEIAQALDDMKSIDLHISFTKKYSEKFLREILQQVIATPDKKIKRTRAAYYTYLVMNNGKHSRD